MGEFVSNIYGGMRWSNDMYIIWAAPEPRRGNTFVNSAAAGGHYHVITLFFQPFLQSQQLPTNACIRFFKLPTKLFSGGLVYLWIFGNDRCSTVGVTTQSAV